MGGLLRGFQRASQPSQLGETIRTTLVRLGRYWTRRSVIDTRPRFWATRRARRALVWPTPARAAISGIESVHWRPATNASATILRTANSPVVKRQASFGGRGPVAARVRRRSSERARSGERWERLGGK
ncbi:hypothetical protein ASF41_23275 [Methylobacterium sp. Leaf111]|nr:hypothetical protein ASF20_21240 [Methylobacterium sp. Leaf88]KQO69833.1 hypothetical protein ASF18_21680 [Methylobacterium sp. Leaf89]KQP53648.1 hypothetical protein ASF41_23275 [Methylobacterium sp. Leaf111]